MQSTDAVGAMPTAFKLSRTRSILGDYAIPVQGFSMIVQDSTSQFMNHFYHWWGEIILDVYRYSDGLQWRDRAGVDGPLMRAAFPSTAIETSYYWDDLIKLRLNQTVVFERAMIISRPAAHRSPLGSVWFKMIASTTNISAPAKFWEPVRTSAIQNLLGYIPKLDPRGAVMSPAQVVSSKPVVTYISRQGGGRRLRDADHQGLVVEELEAEGVCEVFVARMETMSIKEQVAAAARSTHQIWMPPSPRSTTIRDILARNMGHRHYAVWNDTLATYPAGTYHEGVNFSDAFHGNDMAVSGAAVARMIRQRLTEPIFT
ncbi:hypothetical protein BD779DRAFT_1529729 [Infundibulicybe gibba]|nr:hypothetical protein BD779DRAFT_1529729 [Infundibulicybe gibba]